MDRPRQKSSGVPLRKPPSRGKLFWLTVPGHFLWAGWFNCECQGASSGARYRRTRLISSSRLPVVPATRAPRARGQTNKGNSVSVSLSPLRLLWNRKKKKKQSCGMGSQKCENGFPSSFDVKSLVSRVVYSLIKRREAERVRWRGEGWRRKKGGRPRE